MSPQSNAERRMLEELARLPATEQSRAIERHLAEARARVERGELPPPEPWRPDFPDLFGNNWECLLINPSSPPPGRRAAETAEEQLRRQVRDQLAQLAASEPASTVADELLHRHLVDETERRLFDRPLEGAERLAFLEMAAAEIRRMMREAADAAAAAAPALDETIRVQGQSVTTVATAGSDPRRVHRQLEKLDALSGDDARYYRLVQLAGRTTDEVAVLLGLPAEEVLDRVKWAITEVTLDD